MKLQSPTEQQTLSHFIKNERIAQYELRKHS